MAHHGNFRNLLHKNKLEAFKAWVAADPRFRVLEPTGHPYEVFRMDVYDPSGTNPHMPFYLRERSEHVSIPEHSVPFVQEFIKARPGYNQSKRRAKNLKRNQRRKAEWQSQHATQVQPTKEQIQAVLDEVDAMDLPDGAHWALVHEKLGLDYGDVFPLMEEYGMLGDPS